MRTGARRRRLLLLRLAVQFGAGGLHRLRQRFEVGLDAVRILGLDCFLHLRDGGFDFRLVVGRNLVAVFLDEFFRFVGHRVGAVAGFDAVALLLVLGGVGFGVLHHLLDLVVRETAVRGDGDLLLLAGAEILRGDVEDAVCVDVERHFNLRHAARGRGNAGEAEAADGLVVVRHLAFALQHVDFHLRLVVGGGAENFALLGRDRGVALDQRREDAAERLDTEGQRSHVEEEHVLHFALEHAALDASADRDDFVGVHALVRLLAEELLHHLLHLGHAGHAADENHFVDLRGGKAGVAQAILDRLQRTLNEVIDELLEFRAGQRDGEMLRSARVGGDEREIDFGLLRAGEFALRFFGGFFQALEGHRVLREVDAVLFLKLINEPLDDALVKIVAAEVGVAVGSLHFKHAVADFEDGDIERTAAEVVHGDFFLFLLVEAVGQRGGRRLVDDAEHFEAGDLAGVFGGLALGVVEVGGDGDDCLGDFFAEVGFGVGFHLLENHRRDLRGRVNLVADLHVGVAVGGLHNFIRDALLLLGDFVKLATHEALHGEDGILRVGHRLALRGRADQTLAGFRKRHDGRGRASALHIRNHDGLTALHDGHTGVRRSQIDA